MEKIYIYTLIITDKAQEKIDKATQIAADIKNCILTFHEIKFHCCKTILHAIITSSVKIQYFPRCSLQHAEFDTIDSLKLY